jgi:hypothetical protein
VRAGEAFVAVTEPSAMNDDEIFRLTLLVGLIAVLPVAMYH